MSQTFSAFCLDPRLEANVRTLGYEAPTPIQAEAIPVVMQGKDVLGLAQTGTGKTAAFALPILHKLLSGRLQRTRALILAPTRELAEQIHRAIREMATHTGIRTATVYGGVGMQPQTQNLRGGVEIIVACPGRLLDHIENGRIRFPDVDTLVLDEADRMFDMGFLPMVRRILSYLPKQRQTLLFSATMPDDVLDLAHETLHNPITVKVGTTAPVHTVKHALYPVPQHLKGPMLIALLEQGRQQGDTDSVLVFTRTKHRARRAGDLLCKGGFSAVSLQGNLTQSRRQAAMDGFREGKFQIMVATDIAARGIDVSTITHVINFDMPDTVDAYIHRIGRTGRAERTGDAFTLVTDEDTAMVRGIERVLKAPLERRHLDGFDYKAPPPPKSATSHMGRMRVTRSAPGRHHARPHVGSAVAGEMDEHGRRPQAAQSGQHHGGSGQAPPRHGSHSGGQAPRSSHSGGSNRGSFRRYAPSSRG